MPCRTEAHRQFGQRISVGSLRPSRSVVDRCDGVEGRKKLTRKTAQVGHKEAQARLVGNRRQAGPVACRGLSAARVLCRCRRLCQGAHCCRSVLTERSCHGAPRPSPLRAMREVALSKALSFCRPHQDYQRDFRVASAPTNAMSRRAMRWRRARNTRWSGGSELGLCNAAARDGANRSGPPPTERRCYAGSELGWQFERQRCALGSRARRWSCRRMPGQRPSGGAKT